MERDETDGRTTAVCRGGGAGRGILLCAHPERNGRHERLHRTLKAETTQERLMRVVDTQGYMSRNKKTRAPEVLPMSSD